MAISAEVEQTVRLEALMALTEVVWTKHRATTAEGGCAHHSCGMHPRLWRTSGVAEALHGHGV